MERIKLNNERILELIPMGINSNNFNKTRSFSFVTDLNYEEIEVIFSASNISNIEYLSIADELLKTYKDCISLKSLTKEFNKQVEDNIIADVYTVVLETA